MNKELGEVDYCIGVIDMLMIWNTGYSLLMLLYKDCDVLRPSLIFYEIDHYLFFVYISVLLKIGYQW